METVSAPLHRLPKAEIVWLATHRCEHRHTFLEHYACHRPVEERIGYWDIETSNLDADFGIMLSYAFLDSQTGKVISDVITPEDIRKAKAGDEDKRLVAHCIEDMQAFDRVVTYYGTRFDMPYLRTRALACGLDFPYYGTLKHTDVYFMVRNRFRLSRNRLENACRVLLGRTDKTHIEAKYWRGGARGDKASLAYILDHNKKDVVDLQKLYLKVRDFCRKTDTSL